MGTLRMLLIILASLFGVVASQPAEAAAGGRESAEHCFQDREGWAYCAQLVAGEDEFAMGTEQLSQRLIAAVQAAYPNSSEVVTTDWNEMFRMGLSEESGDGKLHVAGRERRGTKAAIERISRALNSAAPAKQTESVDIVKEPTQPQAQEAPTNTTAPTTTSVVAENHPVEPTAVIERVLPIAETQLFTKEELDAARAAGREEGQEAVGAMLVEVLAQVAALQTQNASLVKERNNLTWLLRAERRNVTGLSAENTRVNSVLVEKTNKLDETAAALILSQRQLSTANEAAGACQANLNTVKKANADLESTLSSTRVYGAGGAALFLALGVVGLAVVGGNRRRQADDSDVIAPSDVGRILHGDAAAKEVPPTPVEEPKLEPQPVEPPDLVDILDETIVEAKPPTAASQALQALELDKSFERVLVNANPAPTQPTTINSVDPANTTAYAPETLRIAGLIGKFLNDCTSPTAGPWTVSEDELEQALTVARGIANGPTGVSLDHQRRGTTLVERLEKIIDQPSTSRQAGEVRSVFGQLRALCEDLANNGAETSASA